MTALKQIGPIGQGVEYSCCAPSAKRSLAAQAQPRVLENESKIRCQFVSLPDGTFLMGTDSLTHSQRTEKAPYAPLLWDLDVYPVTNQDFIHFVEATGHETESERFDWSFVFWMHLPPDRLEELVEDTVAAAPWWCKVPGAFWRPPEGPSSHVHDRLNHPVVRSWRTGGKLGCSATASPWPT